MGRPEAASADRDPEAARVRSALLMPALLAGLAALIAPPDGGAQTAADEAYVEPLLYQALETEKSGVEVPWSNPATGSSGTIVIERTFYRDPTTPCRDYRRTIEQAGASTLEIEGTGCRVAPGRWALDEADPTSLAATPAPAAGPNPPPDEPAAPEPARVEADPPSCPALEAAPVPCGKPPPVVDYTMPTRTSL